MFACVLLVVLSECVPQTSSQVKILVCEQLALTLSEV